MARLKQQAVWFATALVIVLALDHATKLGAALIEPPSYTHNPSGDTSWWLLLVVPVVACLLRSRLAAASGGVLVGAAIGNVADSFLWPGGTPDFIRWGDYVYNVADFLIYAGACGLVIASAALLLGVIRREMDPRHREPPAEIDAASSGELPRTRSDR